MIKLCPFLCLLFLISCKNNKSGEPENAPIDTIIRRIDTSFSERPQLPVNSGDISLVNQLLQEKFGGTLAVLTDESAGWSKDDFDYFIAARRKENPDYPYLTRGDFNGDNQTDVAALVKTKGKAEYQLAIFSGQPLDQHRISFWKEDIEMCAISTYPKGKLAGMDQTPFDLKGDAISVEYFERATFVIYWDGKAFKRTYTGD